MNIVMQAKRFQGAGLETHKLLVNYYNWHCVKLVKPSRRYDMKLKDDWCAMFVSAVAHMAGYSVEEFPYEVSVFYMCELARERGMYSTDIRDVRVGDLLVYDWLNNGSYDHVGVVEGVEPYHLKVIEGNYSNTVKQRTVNRSSKAIKGYVALGSGGIFDEGKRLESLVKDVMKGMYGNGDERVEALGDDYKAVQAMVNRLLK